MPETTTSVGSPLRLDLDGRRAQFAAGETEDAFQAEQLGKQRHVLLAIAVIILLIDSSSFLIDLLRNNEEIGSVFLVIMRALAMLGGALFIGYSLAFKTAKRYALATEAYIVLILAIMLTMIFTHGDYGFIAPVTLICAIFALYILAPLNWYKQITYTWLSTVFGIVSIAMRDESIVDFSRLAQWLIFAHASGMLVSWQRQISQRRLFRQRIELEHAHRLEKQGRVHHQALVDLLSHELRNPLASIHTQAELLQRTGDAVARRHASEISRASDRIRDMLRVWVEGDRLAGTEGFKHSQNQVTLTANEFSSLTQQVVGRTTDLYPQLRVKLDTRFGMPAVQVDARTYAVVLLNLLDNAAKYGGRKDRAMSDVTVSIRVARDRVWVRVRDWGRGIPYDQQEKVFEKHERTAYQDELQAGGLGVGLHLCRQLLSLRQGRIWLYSRPGLGSAFVIDLPRSTPNE